MEREHVAAIIPRALGANVEAAVTGASHHGLVLLWSGRLRNLIEWSVTIDYLATDGTSYHPFQGSWNIVEERQERM